MILSDLIDRMVAAGLSPGEAGSIAAEIYAAGVASASVRSPGAERQRRYRASHSDGKRHQTSRGDVVDEASPNVTKRHQASQCDANAVSPIDTNIKKGKRQNSERASRGARIDPNWSASEADRLIAKQEGFSENEINREALRFRDYWTGRAGAGGVKLDWPATWRNWVRTSAEKLGKTPQRTGLVPHQTSGFYAKFGSEEQDAWDRFGQAKSGKSFPRDNKGGWRHPTQWPPGYETPEPPHDPPPGPILRTMQ